MGHIPLSYATRDHKNNTHPLATTTLSDTHVCSKAITHEEEMKGSVTSRARHIRIDLASKEELNQILHSGVFPMNGQLLEVTQFLSTPDATLLFTRRRSAKNHRMNAVDGEWIERQVSISIAPSSVTTAEVNTSRS